MIDFESLQREALSKDIKVFPQHKLRASSLGDECERRAYYSIHNWGDRIPHDAVLQSIFNVGNVLEKHHAIPLINKMRGIRLIEQQTAYAMTDPEITMSLDGKILVEEENEYVAAPVGSKFPAEIKTATPWDFNKLSTIEDFTKSKKAHQRGYVTQLQLYLLGTGSETGYFILVNKITGQLKFIPVAIDLAFCDAILAKAKRIYTALKEEKEPERIDDIEQCRTCAFRQICLPTMSFEAVKILDTDEMIAKLQEREELKEKADRYKELDDEIKESFKAEGIGQFITGEWVAKVTEKSRPEYVVKASKWLEARIARIK